jgi:PAS domain S-box-containing protein
MIKSGEINNLIVENVNDLVAVINNSFKFEYINEVVHKKLTGYSNENLIGNEVLSFIHLEDHKKILYEIDNSLQTGIDFTELRFKHKDGHYIWIESNGKQFVDKDGEKKFLTISRDITKRKSAEEKLKDSEEKYHSLFNSLPYFIGLMDVEGTLIDCNPAVNNFLSKHKREEIIGLNFIRILSILEENKKLIPQFKKLLKDTISDGKIKTHEFKLHRSRGRFLWLRIEGSPIQIGAQKLIQFIIQDITERKNTEEKLRRSEFKLQDRVKELGSIYKLSRLIENPNINIASIFQGTIALIPSAFQFPDSICARILYKNQSYSTINFKVTNWKLSAREMINANELDIEVYYLEEITFLKEEIDIIGEFGLRLKSGIEEREAKKKLKESEEKYRIISETAYDLIIVLNKKFKYEYINESAFKQILGYSKEDLLGKSALKFAHPDDVANTTRILFDGFKQGKGEAEFRLKHKEGHWLWFEGKGKTFSNNDGDLKAIIISRDVTERKIIEQKLRESEERYRLISENANDLIRVLNDRFEFEYINENVHKRLLGYTIEDLRGKTHLPFLHPDDRRRAIKATVKNLKKGEGSYQARFKDRNGKYKWFEFAGKYFYDSKGQKKILSIARDINERKIAELKLKESEEKYRLFSETAYDLIAVLNTKFKIEYVNENALQQILGYSKEDILGKPTLKFVHSDDLNLTSKALFEGFKRGMGEAEVRLRHKDGHWVWFEVRGKTFLDKDGKFKALLILRDFTERRITEEKLKQSEERYRLISQNSDENLFIFDMNLNLIYNNPNVPNILGYSYEEMKKLKLTDYNVPTSLKIALKAYKEEMRNERKKLKDPKRIRTFEGEQIHKNGSIVNVETKFTFLRDPNGEPTAVLGLSRNITKRKQAEQKLKESEMKYRKAYNRAKFYKDLFAHDMNNILAIITSSSELIPYYLTESKKSNDIKGLTMIVQNQVERGAKLIRNVNILSELEEEETNIKPTEVCELMRNSMDLIKKIHNHGTTNIEVNCAEDKLIINANELLHDVFDNILINAIKYNENSSIEISINITKTQVDGKKFNKFEFIDNGIGVPDNRKEIIFKRGNRELKGSKGMGIGLSLVKKIIKSYDGKIWVEDKVKGDFSKGSNFILLIPDTF